MEPHPGLHYGSGAPAQPSSMSYPEAVYSSPGNYPAGSSHFPGMSGGASWNAAPGWDPVEEPSTAYTGFGTSQPAPDFGLPPPPFFQAGELSQYEGNMEHGNSERETEELSFPPPPLPLLPPLPPLPTYPGLGFQAGELSQYEYISEHGNEERETEEQGFGFMPPPPLASEPLYAPLPHEAELSPSSMSVKGPVELRPVGRSQHYLFLTGQLPPGTYSHYKSAYEQGRDHWDETHYERFHFPVYQNPAMPTQQKQEYSKI